MVTKINNKLARNLETLRRARGLSQAQLASLSGAKRSTISTIENGTANPTLSNVIKLCEALNVTVDELISSVPHLEPLHCKGSDLVTKVLAEGLAFKTDLLPKNIPGVQFEKVTLRPHGAFPGVPHLKGTWEYFTCVQGEVLVAVEGVNYTVKKGDVLSFPGDRKHSYRNVRDSESIGISIVVLEGRSAAGNE